MDKKTRKKGEGLVKKMPHLKTDSEVGWWEGGEGDDFMIFCELLERNAIPAKTLYLGRDDREEIKNKRKKAVKTYDENEINR